MARYLRFAALGDSTTHGIGDPVPAAVSPMGWRGWARLLATSLATSYDVSSAHLTGEARRPDVVGVGSGG